MVVGYDKINVNYRQLLALPFNEGVGAETFDVSKIGRLLTLNDPGGGSFNWDNVAVSGRSMLEFITVGGGVGDGVYLDCPAADTVDLNFTSGDYSVGCWINGNTSIWSGMIIGRGAVETDGWDLYTNASGGLNTISQRHAHVSGGAGNLKSECFSTGWTPGTWWFLGMSRSGIYTPHYRNGVALPMDYGGGTMLDPDTANRDLIIGARYDLTSNWYKGSIWNLRVWGRALSPIEWKFIYEAERPWFGI